MIQTGVNELDCHPGQLYQEPSILGGTEGGGIEIVVPTQVCISMFEHIIKCIYMYINNVFYVYNICMSTPLIISA